MKKLILILSSLVFLSSCTTVFDYLENRPNFLKVRMNKNLEKSFDDAGFVGIGSTTAQHRIAISRVNYSSNTISVCAEPLPDLSRNKTNKLILENIEKFKFDNVTEVKGILLSERHPATEFYKSGLFSICLMAMSDFITRSEATILIKDLTQKAENIFLYHIKNNKYQAAK